MFVRTFKAVLPVAAVVTSLSIASVRSLAQNEQNPLRSAAMTLSKKLHDDDDVKKLKGERIVVAEFENINGKGDAVPRIFQEMLTTEFIQQKHFKVVERSQLTKALTELKLGMSDLSDSDNVKKLGKIVGASYILLGSISDVGGGKISITGRIVSVEQAESVAADDVTVDSATAPQGSNDSSNVPVISESASMLVVPTNKGISTLTLDIKTESKAAGRWLVAPPNFGVLSGTNFNTEWAVPISSKDLAGFALGDVYGDGTPSLITVSHSRSDYDSLSLAIWQIRQKDLKKIWQSGSIGRILSSYIPTIGVVKIDTHNVLLVSWLSSGLLNNVADSFSWDGSSFREYILPSVIMGGKIDNINGSNIVYSIQSNQLVTKEVNYDDSGMLTITEKERSNNSFTTNKAYVADIDSDQFPEVITINTNTGVLYILNKNGSIKFSIEGFSKEGILPSNELVRVWKIDNILMPYIIVVDNAISEHHASGGYFRLVQFTGKDYERVWTSRRFGDEIVDIQVGDPKDLKATGITVLSRTGDKYELTKIGVH